MLLRRAHWHATTDALQSHGSPPRLNGNPALLARGPFVFVNDEVITPFGGELGRTVAAWIGIAKLERVALEFVNGEIGPASSLTNRIGLIHGLRRLSRVNLAGILRNGLAVLLNGHHALAINREDALCKIVLEEGFVAVDFVRSELPRTRHLGALLLNGVIRWLR